MPALRLSARQRKYRRILSVSAQLTSTRDLAGERAGSVTRFDRPKSIAFHHNMLLKRWPLIANIDAHILYTIEPIDSITAVTRDIDLTFQIPGIMKLAKPLVLSAFRKENVRLLPACAVQRRRFPVGANPTRQSLQPEAIGAVMEVTKWLKPSNSGHDLVTARVCRPQRE